MIQLIYFSLNVEAEIQILLVSNLLICIWIGMLLKYIAAWHWISKFYPIYYLQGQPLGIEIK